MPCPGLEEERSWARGVLCAVGSFRLKSPNNLTLSSKPLPPSRGDRSHRLSDRWFSRLRRRRAGYRSPLADLPPGNEPILNVWIVAGEVASHLGRISAEEKSGSVDGIPQCAGQDYLAAIAGLPGEAQVLISILSSPLDIVRNDIVDQEIMHRSPGC